MKKRMEAFQVKTVDPMFSVAMNIMPHRYDATNTTMIDIECEKMDEFINKMRAEGNGRYSYLHIFIAAIVRTFAMRPQLNRFTINSRLYERYGITVCFMIKQTMTEEAEELLIKHTFCGHETIEQIRTVLEAKIYSTLEKKTGGTLDTAKSISGLPIFAARIAVGVLKRMDKHNMLPKKFFDVSPFHCSFFVTHLKSIKTESINHHCYDFGTTSLFFAIGKDKYVPVVNSDMEIVPAKMLKLGVSCDERICDGYYYGKSFHLLKRFLTYPEELLVEYHDEKVDKEIERQRIEAEKEAQKEAKAQKKLKKGKQTDAQ